MALISGASAATGACATQLGADPLDDESVLRRLSQEFFGKTPSAFQASGSPDEAARRLASATPRSILRTLFSEAVVGPVSAEKVVLQRHQPFKQNALTPEFRGRFVVEAGRTVLVGVFQVNFFVRVFMTIWFGCIAVAVVAAIVEGATQPMRAGTDWARGLVSGLAMLGPALLMGAAGAVFVHFGKRLARGDESVIREHIERALGAPDV